jgi:PBP1b-binding outer membrane lipoprotein LpoB
MKIQTTILTVIAATAFFVVGCSKQSVEKALDDTKAAVASVDTTKIEAAFASADAATKTALEPVVTAVKNADYAGAVKQL